MRNAVNPFIFNFDLNKIKYALNKSLSSVLRQSCTCSLVFLIPLETPKIKVPLTKVLQSLCYKISNIFRLLIIFFEKLLTR